MMSTRIVGFLSLGISYIFTIFFTVTLFMPMFVKMDVTSAYEVMNDLCLENIEQIDGVFL